MSALIEWTTPSRMGAAVVRALLSAKSGSLLIQAGVSPAYVQKQMGHRSIQVTIDVYGHLIPGENVAWIDTLDSTPRKVTATDAHQTHTQSRELEEESQISRKL